MVTLPRCLPRSLPPLPRVMTGRRRWRHACALLGVMGVICVVTIQRRESGHSNMDVGELNITGQTLRPERIPWLSSSYLPRRVNKTHHDQYIHLLGTLTQLFFKANVTFIMCDGTLLGSYMAHGMLAWDDDMDLMVKLSDIDKVRNIFKNDSLWKEYQIHSYNDKVNQYDQKILTNKTRMEELSRDVRVNKTTTICDKKNKKCKSARQKYYKFKFFARNSSRAGGYRWKWPFIDVKYYKENSTHVWKWDSRRTLPLPRDVFYPLHYRPFASLWLPAPRDTRGFLKEKYHTFRCGRSGWSHARERRGKAVKTTCDNVYDHYPWVRRSTSPFGVKETLEVGGHVIHSVIVEEYFHQNMTQFQIN